MLFGSLPSARAVDFVLATCFSHKRSKSFMEINIQIQFILELNAHAVTGNRSHDDHMKWRAKI